MALSKHTDNHHPEKSSAQYPHDAANKAFSGNDEHELLNPTEVTEGKEKYLGDIANIEDVRGDGGEPVDEQSSTLQDLNNQHDKGKDIDGLRPDLDNTGISGL